MPGFRSFRLVRSSEPSPSVAHTSPSECAPTQHIVPIQHRVFHLVKQRTDLWRVCCMKKAALLYASLDAKRLQLHLATVEDASFLRDALSGAGLVRGTAH